jgi:hypothetical protein
MKFKAFQYEECLILMDTEREREIGLGSQYPYPALKTGECLVGEEYASILGVTEGDYIYQRISMGTNF